MSLPEVEARFGNLSLNSAYAAPSANNASQANYRLPRGTLPPSGTQLTVRVMTEDQKRVIKEALEMKEKAAQLRAEAQEEIALGSAIEQKALARAANLRGQAQAGEARLQEEMKKRDAEIAKRDAEIAKLNQILQTIQTRLQSIRPLNQNDPTALSKIDGLVRSVAALRGNIPADSNARSELFKKLQAEAQLVMSSVKTK
jgi:hypothetical protein